MKSVIRVFLGALIISAVCMVSDNLVLKAEAGMTLGSQIDVYIGANEQLNQSAGYDSVNNRFLVAWTDAGNQGSDNRSIYAQLINADGSLVGGRITIYANTTNLGGDNPRVAFDTVNQRFLVAWNQTYYEGMGPSGTGSEVTARFVNSDGSFSGSSFLLTPMASGFAPPPNDNLYEYVQDVVFDPILNRFAVLISGDVPVDLYIRFVNGDGSLGDFIKVVDFISGGAWSSKIGYDSNSGRFLIAYGNGDDGNIYGRILNSDATPYGSEFVISDEPEPQGGTKTISSLAFDPINNKFMAIFDRAWWQHTIQGQLLNADGTLNDAAITISSNYASNGSAIFDTVNKKFLVVYMSYVNTLAQLLNPDGSFSGPAFNITGYSINPLISGGPSNFLATWNVDFGAGKDIYAKAIRVLDDYLLYMPEMPWIQVESQYNSTGAAVAFMILDYIHSGAPVPSQSTIYTYAKSPAPFTGDLTPDEMAKVLGHFDPYDSLISNWSDNYDSLPGGNPYKGYNFSVDSYDPNSDPSAQANYMRDICHWMAYTVTKEDWWRDGELVARPNTPAAIPIFGTYDHWVAVNGFSASANPTPQPHANPWILPDFTVNAFWMKDPLVNGIGQNAYKTAAECALTYFLPLTTTDNYNGKFVQVAEPPPEISHANVQIPVPEKDTGNLEFIGVKSKTSEDNAFAQISALSVASDSIVANEKPFIKKHDWFDILPAQLLSDADCYAAFSGTQKGKPVFVKRTDVENSDYYLVPFNKQDKKGILLTSGVIILDANAGYFKEASWTKEPERFLKVGDRDAVRIVTDSILNDLSSKLKKLPRTDAKNYLEQRIVLNKNYTKLLGYVRSSEAKLFWESKSSYSLSPYQPYWKIDANGYIWYVTQEGKVIPEPSLYTEML